MEKHRPQIHFTPPAHWMNDPNGMVYYDGEYHLFYQYHPRSSIWGPMYWGHAVSRDLVHWEHLPIALSPDSLGYIFSGSAVIDWHNTTGFGVNGTPPMVAIFTHHDPIREEAEHEDFQYQSIAWSIDRGRTWAKYKGNPVLENHGVQDFRDPKVFWYQPTGRWIMIFAALDHVKIYSSPDLKHWRYESNFGMEYGAHGGVWECPDLFPLQVVNAAGLTKWVMLVSLNPGGPSGGSGTQYFVGDFDGKRFSLDVQFMNNLGRVKAIEPGGRKFQELDRNKFGTHWDVKGDYFLDAEGPAEDSENEITEFHGLSLVSNIKNGHRKTDVLRSQSFTITDKFINFKIGGKKHPGETSIDLLIDGEVVRTSAAHHLDKLQWTSWNVRKFKGKKACFEVTGADTDDWGHILVDFIVFSDQPAKAAYDRAVWLDFGKDNYAGVTWSDIPEEDGRRLMIGWMSNWQYAQIVPTEKMRGMMTLPRSLELIQDGHDFRLLTKPVKELVALRSSTKIIKKQGEADLTIDGGNGLLELELDFDAGEKGRVRLEFTNPAGDSLILGFKAKSNVYYIDRSNSGETGFSRLFPGRHLAPRYYKSDRAKMMIFLDRTSIELFADEGRTVMTETFFPHEPVDRINVSLTRGAKLIRGMVHQLKPAE